MIGALQLKANSCTDVTGENVVFNSLFDQWKTDVRNSVRASSFCFYETMLERHLRPYFGELRVEGLTTAVAQNFVGEKLKENLSPAYIRSIMILFQTILKSAQEKHQWRVPTSVLQLPKAEKRMPEIFTVQEWTHLEEHLRRQEDAFSFGLLICMYTGMRIGELSGLRWEDYDPVNIQFKIRRTVYRIKNASYHSEDGDSPKTVLHIGLPKTASSIRDIPLPCSLTDDLKKHLKSPESFILTGTKRCMEPRNIQKRYKRLLEQLDLRYLNFHSLRHSFATLSIQNGSDCRTVAELLGHSSVNTTLNIYVHSDMEQKRKCLELLITK
ncbi:MAG: site-specific integrase [Clostridium sp.]|nr:site-specific integrase [Ruminococcus flavefaciens]MCM1499461.1 site-specific integrase [Clostridium sp.]